MPILVTSFFLPAAKGLPFILEDIYVKGGYRSVATMADLGAIPSAAKKPGMLVYCGEDDTIYRLKADKSAFVDSMIGKSGGGGGGAGGTRYETTLVASKELEAGEALDMDLDLSAATAMVLSLSLDLAGITIQLFAESDRSDTNPYTFLSTDTMLKDDGMTLIDGATLKGRRFALISTADGSRTHKVRFTNNTDTSLTPTLSLKYLSME